MAPVTKLLIAAGGTGGHIYPGIAIANEFRRREPGCEILFAGTPRGLESKILPREGFDLEMIKIGALKGVSMPTRIKSMQRLPLSFLEARKLLRRFNPDIVVGVGGYSSGPILLMAALMKIPTLVVEPNAMPGFTNRILSRFVDAAALSFEESLKWFRGRGVITGNPVRGRFGHLPKKQRGDRLAVLIFGGSPGAHSINIAMAGALPLLASKKESLSFTHQTGENDLETVREAYRSAGYAEADVRPFIHDMAEQFEKADLLICRSGATTAAEVAAAGKAAIFIPFPFATDDHQRKNAEAFQRAGAARMILQSELSPERVAHEIGVIAENPQVIESMEAAAGRLGRADAAEKIVDMAISLVEKRPV